MDDDHFPVSAGWSTVQPTSLVAEREDKRVISQDHQFYRQEQPNGAWNKKRLIYSRNSRFPYPIEDNRQSMNDDILEIERKYVGQFILRKFKLSKELFKVSFGKLHAQQVVRANYSRGIYCKVFL